MSPPPPALAVENVQAGVSICASPGETTFSFGWLRVFESSWPKVGQSPPVTDVVAQLAAACAGAGAATAAATASAPAKRSGRQALKGTTDSPAATSAPRAWC